MTAASPAWRVAPPWRRPFFRCLWILRHRRWRRRSLGLRRALWFDDRSGFELLPPVVLMPGESVTVALPREWMQ